MWWPALLEELCVHWVSRGAVLCCLGLSRAQRCDGVTVLHFKIIKKKQVSKVWKQPWSYRICLSNLFISLNPAKGMQTLGHSANKTPMPHNQDLLNALYCQCRLIKLFKNRFLTWPKVTYSYGNVLVALCERTACQSICFLASEFPLIRNSSSSCLLSSCLMKK